MLLIVSWFAVLGGLFTAVAIAIDVLRHSQNTNNEHRVPDHGPLSTHCRLVALRQHESAEADVRTGYNW